MPMAIATANPKRWKFFIELAGGCVGGVDGE
jgi:hypothetical protein